MQKLDEIGCSSKWLIYQTLAKKIPNRSSTPGPLGSRSRPFNIWHHRSDNARPRYVHLRRSSIGTVTIPPHIQVMTDSVVSMSKKKTVFEWKKHEKSQLPNFAPTFGWFSWIFIDFQSCFLFSTPINARRIALGSSTNRSGRCWWAKKTWAV